MSTLLKDPRGQTSATRFFLLTAGMLWAIGSFVLFTYDVYMAWQKDVPTKMDLASIAAILSGPLITIAFQHYFKKKDESTISGDAPSDDTNPVG